MDPSQAQNRQLRDVQARHAQGRPADNRFSWQIPADAASNLQRAGRAQLNLGELTPEQIAAERVRLQEAQRAQQQAQRLPSSIENTPIEYRAPAPFGLKKQPTEPTIPQSPLSPEDPPDAPTTLMAPHSFSQPLSPHQETPAAPATNPSSAPTAKFPPDATAPTPALPTPPPINTDPLASYAEKPKALSPDSRLSAQTPVKPYIPYAETLNSSTSTKDDNTTKSGSPYSPRLPSKSSPYAPDDLVHVHQAAAIQQGRGSVFSTHAPPVDTRAHQPGQIAHPNQRGDTARRDSWSHSLFACAPDADTCCLGLVCPCLVYGRTAYRLGRRDGKSGDPTDMLGFKGCNAACGVMAALGCVGCLFPMVARTRIRHAYKIEGDVGGDCLAAWCCCCCVAVQNEREVREREESKRRYAGPGGGEGYVPPSAEMRYQPGGS